MTRFICAYNEDEVKSYLSTIRADIDSILVSYAQFDNDCPERLASAMRYSLLAPGKRFRPTLATLALELCGGSREKIAPVAVALEATHTYSLIHDDLPCMDDDDLRRGRPTCHRQFDEATAVLAGDALQAWAFDLLSSRIEDEAIAARCVKELARAIGPSGMVGGQMDDIISSNGSCPHVACFDSDRTLDTDPTASSYDLLAKIHRRKTGALILCSLKIGALLGGASTTVLSTLCEYGRLLGQAFQIGDDLLDAVGEQANLGKRVQKDNEHGKLTYVSLFGVDKTRALLASISEQIKDALSDVAQVFDVQGCAFKAAYYMADYVVRRDR
ncbi:MAG: polyprenyl synthetase family protein [Planctomycetia bacterium]|nr:polyprenyl synthetase family protein [Planctomycetia bacterium]